MEFSRAVEGFLLNLAAEGKSENYFRWCQNLLRTFHRWAGSRRITDLEPLDIKKYIRYLQTEHIPYGDGHPLHKPDRRLSPTTVKHHWAVPSTLFSWATREEIVQRNIMDLVPKPKAPKPLKVGFTQDEIKRLLRAIDAKSTARASRDRAILLFLLDTGCRISETTGCRRPDVDLSLGRAKVSGKGAKERFVYVGQEAKKAIWRYVSMHRPEPLPNHDLLFLTHEGRPMTRPALRSLLRRLGSKAEVPNVHAHRFRHTAAVEFLRNGGDVFTLQRMLGHTSMEMVRRYLALVDADVAAVHRRASPADNWGLR